MALKTKSNKITKKYIFKITAKLITAASHKFLDIISSEYILQQIIFMLIFFLYQQLPRLTDLKRPSE